MPEGSTPRSPRARRPRPDAVLEGAVEMAREAAESVARRGTVGDHEGVHLEGERLLTHYFATLEPGYAGWRWAVTLSRVPRGKVATVCEVDLVPGNGALLAPDWVPWEDRLRPSDVTREDVLPYRAEDPRLEPGFEDTGEDPDEPVVRELGLGRVRVLSREGRNEAVERWYRSEHGPQGTRVSKAQCSGCGFLMKMSGSLREVFGVCANEWSPDDGRVVSLDHTCGAHSETDLPPDGPQWPIEPSRVNDFLVEPARMADGAEARTGAPARV
ncbi:MAG: DUF3027 domain-containing protein [Actinomyces sp.]|nr:DUF3027 domain-containing protein [Actinomyces sp.]